jgi:cation:H+ antiporter
LTDIFAIQPETLLGALLFVAAGLVTLAGGGELLVRGAINASRLLRLSPVVIGLTVVAFATSLPELAVSLLAALRGKPDLAVGNVVGSNMFNIAVIIGVTALLFPPLRFRSSKAPADVGVMIFASLALILLGWNGWFGKLEGAAFITGLAVYLWLRVRAARSVAPDVLASVAEAAMEPHGKKPRGIAVSTTLIFLGTGLLTVGAEALVRGAVVIAREAGVADRVIAVTLVSAGTGLPELATAIIAGIRRHTAVAIGNVIGSNIFNVFGILGTVAIVRPFSASTQLIHQDALWMLGISLLALVPVVKPGRNVTRVEGTLLLAVYATYMVWLFRY